MGVLLRHDWDFHHNMRLSMYAVASTGNRNFFLSMLQILLGAVDVLLRPGWGFHILCVYPFMLLFLPVLKS